MTSENDRDRTRDYEPFNDVVGWLVAASLAALALFISPTGSDVFRTPKDLVLVGSAIILATAFLVALVLGRVTPDWIPWKTKPVLLTGAIVTWTLLTTTMSTQPTISVASSRLAIAATVLFVFTYAYAKTYRPGSGTLSPLGLLVVLISCAGINGVLMILQTFEIWSPTTVETRFHGHFMARTALIGNPNIVGTYLVLPALAAIVLTLTCRGRRRVAFAAAAMFLFASVMIIQTRTALVAYIAGVFAIGLVRVGKRAIVWASIPVILIVLSAAVAPRFFRVANMSAAIRSGDIDRVLSGRLISFAAATELFLAHPLTGSGPGTFGWQYLPYRSLALTRWTSLEDAFNLSVNFSEVHNDHLEVLAETGLPGYLLFLTAIAMVAFVSVSLFRSHRGPPAREPEEDRSFARHFGLPLAVSVFVLCLAQFPFQLSAPTSSILVLAAISLGRSDTP